MSANPFSEKVSEFLKARRGCLTEEYEKNLRRRFSRIETDLKRLKDDGKVKTLSPGKLSEDDIKEFIIYRKGKKVCAGDINHDIAALGQLCSFCDNPNVQKCILKNPGLRPQVNQVMLEPLSEQNYRRILEVYNSGKVDHSSLEQSRPYVMVLTYICTGARNKELRLAKISDLDTKEWIIHYEHVKGEESYGEPRNVPIPQELIPVMKQYLYDRDVYLAAHHARSDALFFQLGGKFDHLSGNSIRTSKQIVEKAIGQKFELRDCRRGFGDMYIRKGLSIEQVSVLMGHASTRTTEHYYCRKCESEVIKEAKKLW